MLKILIVSNMYPSKEKPYAGIFVKNQYNRLLQILGPEVIDFFYMKRRFTGVSGSFLKYLGASIRFIPYFFNRYDVLHLHFFYPLILIVWFYRKIHPKTKVIVTFHGSDINRAVSSKNLMIMRYFSEIIDVAIPVGKSLAKEVLQKLNPAKIKILPVGVDEQIFLPEPEPSKIYDFIWLGSFYEIKGIDILIAAIETVNNPDISFCFCGSGEYIGELYKLKERYNVSVFQNLSHLEIAKLLNSSRFLVLMSRNEGFPTATIEAMFCGVPVLTSDIQPFQEQVIQGVNGFMVPLGDVEALSRELIRLFKMDEGEYMQLSKAATNSFKHLSLQEVCDELVLLYRDQIKINT